MNRAAAFSIAILLLSDLALAESIPYSGRLSDASGKPLSGVVDLQVEFYDSVTGGTRIAGPYTFDDIPLSSGVFQIDITVPSASLNSVFGSGATYIQVRDTGRSRTYPRQKFGVVPYALRVPVDGTTIDYDTNGRLQIIGALDTSFTQQDSAFLATDQIKARDADGLQLTNASGQGLLVKSDGTITNDPVMLSNGQLTIADAATNTPATDAVYVTSKPSVTASGTYYQNGIMIEPQIEIASATTNSGYYNGMFSNALRTSATDLGTLSNLRSGIFQYGHQSLATGTTTNAYGIQVVPYHMNGSILNSYSLHLSTANTGGTATNYWGLYQEDANAKNRFAGRVGIGIDPTPDIKLRVEDSRTVSANETTYTFASHNRIQQNINPGVTNSGFIIGNSSTADVSGSGDVGQTMGSANYSLISTSGTVGAAHGLYAHTQNSGTGIISAARGLTVAVINTGTGSITNGIGVYLGDVQATVGYGIYQDGASDRNYFAGQVGIGTTNPGTGIPFEISRIGGAGGDHMRLTNPTAVTGKSWGFASEDTGRFSIIDRTNSRRRLNIEADNDWAMLLSDGASTAVYVDDATGHVGIGTSLPQRKLHVSDAMRLQPIPGPPAAASSGDLYYDTDEALCVYSSGNWLKVVGAGNCG